MTATLDTPPASIDSTDRLAELEAIIARGVQTFVEVGLALAEIRDARLFHATHETFKEYLAARWGFGQQWAYGQIYGAQVAAAITEHHGGLPADISADALRPLVPLLNQEGPEAVGRAWAPVLDRYGDRRRPPSREEIRAVLADAGLVTVAASKSQRVQLKTIGDGLLAAARRVDVLRERFAERPMPPSARAKAAEFAATARLLASDLDVLADGTAATSRLEALQPLEPLPEGELCIGHGASRDANGICRLCRRPEVERINDMNRKRACVS